LLLFFVVLFVFGFFLKKKMARNGLFHVITHKHVAWELCEPRRNKTLRLERAVEISA
jgi:hypothetical protein